MEYPDSGVWRLDWKLEIGVRITPNNSKLTNFSAVRECRTGKMEADRMGCIKGAISKSIKAIKATNSVFLCVIQ